MTSGLVRSPVGKVNPAGNGNELASARVGYETRFHGRAAGKRRRTLTGVGPQVEMGFLVLLLLRQQATWCSDLIFA